MHLPEATGVLVDPALILADEDRRERSARALAAAAARYTERRIATEARAREAFLAYAALAHHPVHLLIMDATAPRPVI